MKMQENNIEHLTDEEKTDRGLAKSVEINTFACENCGSTLSFDPVSRRLKCASCGAEFPMPEPKAVMPIVYTGLSEQEYESWGGVKSVRCENCGATVTLKEFETANVCPFCSSPVVTDIDQIPGLKPNGVLPFAVSEKEAHASFIKWLKKRIFAPHKVKKNAKHTPMKGVYVPTWVFGSNVFCTYEARFGKHYTVTVGSGKNRRTVTKTRWFHVSGTLAYDVKDLTIEASKMITQSQLEKIGGFDMPAAVGYEEEYLSGFASERYSTGLNDSWEIAQDKICNALRNMVRARHPHDVEDYINIAPVYNGTTYKYVLAPLWVSGYKYRKRDYGFVVNGRNGKVAGKSPVSVIRAILAGLLALAAAAGIGYLIYVLFV